jgi:CO dehydrogenase nickel-insertion accessory protein CooC1
MPKVLVCGRGGSGKSTLVTMLSRILGERSKVLVTEPMRRELEGMIAKINRIAV